MGINIKSYKISIYKKTTLSISCITSMKMLKRLINISLDKNQKLISSLDKNQIYQHVLDEHDKTFTILTI